MSRAIEAIRHFYDAINRFDLDAALRDMDAAVVRIEPRGFPRAGEYHGLEALRCHIEQGRGGWAEGACAVEEIFENGARAVAYVHFSIRLKDGAEVGGRLADGFEFGGGRIVRYLSFADRYEALRWAGLEEDEARAA